MLDKLTRRCGGSLDRDQQLLGSGQGGRTSLASPVASAAFGWASFFACLGRFAVLLQERRNLGTDLFLMANTEMAAARITDEARVWNMLGGVASTVPCSE